MAWIHHIRDELTKAEVNTTISKICENFLEDRDVTSGKIKKIINMGCPQCSSLGHTLWLITMQGWFSKINEKINNDDENNLHTQAYAHDQIIIIARKSAKKIEKNVK